MLSYRKKFKNCSGGATLVDIIIISLLQMSLKCKMRAVGGGATVFRGFTPCI